MSSIFDDIRGKVQEAKNLQNAVDASTMDMAKLITDRLRVSFKNSRMSWTEVNTLNKLKYELRDWNINTGRWK